MERKTFNVILLSLGFSLLFTAFGTCTIIEKIVLESFGINGYISQSIIYLVFAISNWFAPSVIAVTGPKYGMVFAGTLYSVFMVFFLKPVAWCIYLGSAMLGFAAAILWVSENIYNTVNSTDDTLSRNIGFFAFVFPWHNFVGNLYVWYRFREEKIEISDCSREKIFVLLFVTSLMGVVVLSIMEDKRSPDPDAYKTPSKLLQGYKDRKGPFEAFKKSVKLLCKKEMILLFIVKSYAGILIMFHGSVYPTSIGHTQQFGEKAKQLIGLHGLMIGVSEVIGGLCVMKFGRRAMRSQCILEPLFLTGTLVHVTGYLFAYLNLPTTSPVEETDNLSFIAPPSVSIALVTSFLLGIGSSFFFSQLFTLMSLMFFEDSAPAFAITKSFSALSAALGFYCTNYLPLSYQSSILGLLCIIAAISYTTVRHMYQRRSSSSLSKMAYARLPTSLQFSHI